MTTETDSIRNEALKCGLRIQAGSMLDECNVMILDLAIDNCETELETDRETLLGVIKSMPVLTELVRSRVRIQDAMLVIRREYEAMLERRRQQERYFRHKTEFAKTLNGIECHPELIDSWYTKPKNWDAEMAVVSTFLALKRKNGKIRGFYNSIHMGPKGVGKTETLNEMSLYLFRKPAVILDPKHSPSAIVGASIPVPAGDGSVAFKYAASTMAKAIQEPGIVVIDEYDATRKDLVTLYNTVLASGFIETQNPEQPFIYRDPECLMFACANSAGNGGNGDYVRNALDSSTLNRFSGVYEDEWDTEVANKLDMIRRDEGEAKPDTSEFVRVCEEFDRACLRTGMTKYTPSYRTVMNYTLYAESGLGPKEIAGNLLVRGMNKSTLGKIIAEMRYSVCGETYMKALTEIHAGMSDIRSW